MYDLSGEILESMKKSLGQGWRGRMNIVERVYFLFNVAKIKIIEKESIM